jgi:type VI secretion system secreted protein VgrG
MLPPPMSDNPLDQLGAAEGDSRIPQLVCALTLHDDALPSGWRVRGFDIVEELSGLHSATIDLEHDDDDADPRALLGASATLVIGRADLAFDEHRFSGIVRAIERGRRRGSGKRSCRARLEPAFACLAEEVRTTRFEDLTVPAILDQVIKGGLTPFGTRGLDLRLVRADASTPEARQFAVRETCAQYGESTYDFCLRLLAEEGLSFFFEDAPEEGGGEVMVVVDENSQFPLLPRPIPLIAPEALPESESIFTFWQTRAQAPAQATLQPFEPFVPEATWTRRRSAKNPDDAGHPGEVFDPRPGVTFHGYRDHQYSRSDSELQAQLRLEQARVDGHVIQGTGNVLALAPGRLFKLRPSSAADLTEWAQSTFLVTAVRHRTELAAGAGPHAALSYTNEFTCMPREIAFRPRQRPKPRAVHDFAEVVSASDDDPIWTDRHGRVRVRFHADRADDGTEERPSAWVPLAQAWSGDGFGAQVIPRAGMLVQIEYTFGDPDRPIITACLPTGTNQLPYPLPDERSHSAIRTRSLREGGAAVVHHNEVGLDDQAEAEELLFRAGHDLRQKVLQDEQTDIAHDDALVVGGDQELEVRGPRQVTIDQGETVTVRGSRAALVEGSDAWTVALTSDGAGGSSTDVVDQERTLVTEGNRTTEVQAHEKLVLGDGRDEIGPGDRGDDDLHVTRTRAVTADSAWRAAQGETAALLQGGDATLVTAGDIKVSNAHGKLVLTPDGAAAVTVEQLRIVCGGSQLTLAGDTLAFRATEVVARGAMGAVRLGPQGVATSGAGIVSSAVMLNELKGPLVVIADTPGSVEPLVASHTVAALATSASTLAAPETVDLEAILKAVPDDANTKP